MRYDEPLVAGVAITLSLFATAIAIGPWHGPYRLRTIDAVVHRYGKSAARLVWCFVAVIMFVTGLAIISGVRPTYAVPSQDVSVEH